MYTKFILAMPKNNNTVSKSQAEVWKEFDHNPITHSAAHYLMTINELVKELGYARLTDIAERMEIRPGSCSLGIQNLKKKGFVQEDKNKFLSLTDHGLQLVNMIERNDHLLEYFFHYVLGITVHQAEVDACKMEHLLSEETSVRLANFVNLMKQKPKLLEEIYSNLDKKEPICHHDVSTCEVCERKCFIS